jgi:nicotinamidase-related amidase
MHPGMSTNYCGMCTTIDPSNRDYDVILVDDLNCTMAADDGTDAGTMHRITVETLRRLNARCCPAAPAGR